MKKIKLKKIEPRFIAGPPGTGKTHVYIVGLFEELVVKYSYKKILILSHTNVAAEQILEAIFELKNLKTEEGHYKFPQLQGVTKKELRETIGNGKVVLFGLPGAFTSTCSKLHLPGFVANADKIKAKGIENIFCLSVNDPYVMNGWGEINNAGDKIKMLSDPYLLFTKAIGAEVDRNAKGMGIRSNRYLMVIENFTVINIHVEKETKECGLTSAENLLNNLI